MYELVLGIATTSSSMCKCMHGTGRPLHHACVVNYTREYKK